MSWSERLFGFWGDQEPPTAARAASRPGAGPVKALAFDLSDPAMAAWMRDAAGLGVGVSPRAVLRNAAVARSVFLISNAIGALPLNLMRRGSNSGAIAKADDHPLHDVLARRPNSWQTAFEFRRLMQQRVLVAGNAFALIVRAGGKVTELIPIDPSRVTVKQRADWTVWFEYRQKDGKPVPIERGDMLHVMGPSEDGLSGMALVSYAGETLGLALDAQRAAAKLFRQGMMAGGMLTTKGSLSVEAISRLREQMEQFQGADNAGKWIVGEQGLEAQPFGTAKDSQNVETRAHQVEEVARIFGVPRPFLMVDDTSWGSGIEQLGIYFVQYGLAPHFVAWEQAIDRVLLTDVERRTLYPKFNERALLRGSMKDQAEFFAKALGSGGGRAWMTQDEVRGLSDLAPAGGQAGELGMGAMAAAGAGSGAGDA